MVSPPRDRPSASRSFGLAGFVPRGRRILVIRFSPLCGPGRSAWPRPASPGQRPLAADAGPRPRADAPGPPSRPPRPSTPSPLPRRTRPAARPGSSPMSRPLTSADAGYTRSSSSRTPLADRATGTPPGCGRNPVNHRPVITPPAAPRRISGQEPPQALPLLISQVMAFQSVKHRTDLHDPATKIHGTRPSPAPRQNTAF